MGNEEIASRLRLLRETLNENQARFAQNLGIPRTTLINYEKGTSIPAELLIPLISIYKVNVRWLLHGDGEMFLDGKSLVNKTGTVPVLNEDKKNFNSLSIQYQKTLLKGTNIFQFDKKRGLPTRIKTDEASGENFVFVPVFNQKVSAGPGQEETQLSETERAIPVMLSLFGGIHKPVHCGLAQATGDSMIDIGIFGGDWCLFDMNDRKGDGIFLITMYGETRIKRLYYRLAEQKIVIASENQKRYPEPEMVSVETMESGQLIVHGRVFASFHLMTV